MTLIFDEEKYAINLLSNSSIENYIKWRDMLILAKYFRYLGKKESDVRKELINFCFSRNPEFNEVIYDSSLSSAMKRSEKQNLHLSYDIIISQSEMDSIRDLHNYKYEKILFVMLVISRYGKLANKNSSSKKYYINYDFSTIVSFAKVYALKDERDSMKHYFYEQGKIEAIPPNSRYYCNGRDNFKILFANDNSCSAILVPSPDNSSLFYHPLCEKCGAEIDNTYRKKYTMCDNCYDEKRKEDIAFNVYNYRKNVIS